MAQKLLVAFPIYRQIPAEFFANWLTMDRRHVAATVTIDGAYLPVGLSAMVREGLESDSWDRMVIFEQDMIPPRDVFNRIVQYGDEHDVVGSLYFQHEWPHHVNVCMQVDYPNYSPLTAEAVRLMHDNPGLYEVDGVSTGFTSISRRVFEQWDSATPMWSPQSPFVTHDMWFCHQAKKQGFRVWVDSGIGCGHLTQLPIGYPDSQEALASAGVPTWAQGHDHGGAPLANVTGVKPLLTVLDDQVLT